MKNNQRIELVKFTEAEKLFQHLPLRDLIKKVWSGKCAVNKVEPSSEADDAAILAEGYADGEGAEAIDCSSVRLYVKVPSDCWVYSQDRGFSELVFNSADGRKFFHTNFSEVFGCGYKWDRPEPINQLQYARYLEDVGGNGVERFDCSLFYKDIEFLEIRTEDFVSLLSYESLRLCMFHYGFSRDEKGFPVWSPRKFQYHYSVHPKGVNTISIVPMESKGNFIQANINENIFLEAGDVDFLKCEEVSLFFDGEFEVENNSDILEIMVLNAMARKWHGHKMEGRSRSHKKCSQYFISKLPNSFLVLDVPIGKRHELPKQTDLYKVISRLVFDVARTTGSKDNLKRESLDVSALDDLKKEMPYAGERLLILNKLAMNIKKIDRKGIDAKRYLEAEARGYKLEEEELDLLVRILQKGILV